MMSKHPTPMTILLSPSVYWGFEIFIELNKFVFYFLFTPNEASKPVPYDHNQFFHLRPCQKSP